MRIRKCRWRSSRHSSMPVTAVVAAAAAVAAIAPSAPANDLNYLTLAVDGQSAGGGLVLSVAGPPALIDAVGRVAFNAVLHDPNQVSNSFDLAAVEFARADGTLQEL